MVYKGPYLFVRLYDFILFLPVTLPLTLWLGFFKVSADGKGSVSIEHNDSDWFEKTFSQKHWWLPFYPFVCVPRDAKGGFWLYGQNRYWFIYADEKSKVTCREVKRDWVTFTGLELKENTRPDMC